MGNSVNSNEALNREIRRLRDMLRLAMKIQSDATARDYAKFVVKVGGV